MSTENNSSNTTSSNSFASSGLMDQMNFIISREMNELSQTDREKLLMERHGVPTNYVEETPELIQDSLEALKKEIQSINTSSDGDSENNNKEGYTLAESMDPNFVHDPNLRIKFLRGERFDTKLAANKLMKHFQVKQKLFGKSKLVKNITQSDLNQEDLDMLYSGRLQILPMKDPAGRTIMQMFPSPGTFCSFQTMVRTE